MKRGQAGRFASGVNVICMRTPVKKSCVKGSFFDEFYVSPVQIFQDRKILIDESAPFCSRSCVQRKSVVAHIY